MTDDVEKILINKEDIKSKVKELGRQISEDYKDKNLFVIGVLKGSFVFLSDLIREITVPLKIDFMGVSSYGNKAVQSGKLKITKDIDANIKDYDILIIEDILDSGFTLSYIIELFKLRKPKSIKICTLLLKPAVNKADIRADYIGFVIPDEFVVGYGMDLAEKYRNLPFIGILKKEITMSYN